MVQLSFGWQHNRVSYGDLQVRTTYYTQQLSFERAIKIHPHKIRADNRTDEPFEAWSEKVTSMTFSLFFFDSTPRV